jgi:galactokinase/mevalonate kinase-like predicted kinase
MSIFLKVCRKFLENSYTKGSGLGTSSILILTCIQALQKLFGGQEDQEKQFNAVLAIEQMLTTGGGWQVPDRTCIQN